MCPLLGRQKQKHGRITQVPFLPDFSLLRKPPVPRALTKRQVPQQDIPFRVSVLRGTTTPMSPFTVQVQMDCTSQSLSNRRKLIPEWPFSPGEEKLQREYKVPEDACLPRSHQTLNVTRVGNLRGLTLDFGEFRINTRFCSQGQKVK